VVLLVVGAALGLGGLKAAHKLHLTTTSSVAQASAGYDLDAPTAATVEGRDLFVANGAGNSVTESNGNARTLIRIISGPQFTWALLKIVTAIPFAPGRCGSPHRPVSDHEAGSQDAKK
jgi:hypothetical protein